MQVKGQAISPPHNYPVLKQESGIDWPGPGLCDWTCQHPALAGWAPGCKLHSEGLLGACEACCFLPWLQNLPVKSRQVLASPGAWCRDGLRVVQRAVCQTGHPRAGSWWLCRWQLLRRREARWTPPPESVLPSPRTVCHCSCSWRRGHFCVFPPCNSLGFQ